MLARKPLAMLASLVEILPMDDELGAEALHGGQLDRVGGLRHADDGADAENAAANEIDWPWLPVEAVITPLRRSSSLSCETRLTPPRTLKAPTGWWFSCLTHTSVPTSSLRAG